MEMRTTMHGIPCSRAEILAVKSSFEKPSKLEMKELPAQVEYAYIQGPVDLPAIITTHLSSEETTSMIRVLKEHERAFEWKITDIKGNSPSYCTHESLIESDFEPVVQPLSRLNPKVTEVARKEMIKLLDTELIYQMSDSPRVSPVHVVPENEGTTVVANERCEDPNLVPDRGKCHLVVCEGILLGHTISSVGIEVDKAKTKANSMLPLLINVKAASSFLGHAEVHHRIIKNLSKIARPKTFEVH